MGLFNYYDAQVITKTHTKKLEQEIWGQCEKGLRLEFVRFANNILTYTFFKIINKLPRPVNSTQAGKQYTVRKTEA